MLGFEEMTAEVKYYLDLADILAVQIECSACGVKSSFPVGKIRSVRHSCPHCNADWILPETAAGKALTTFLMSLPVAAEALQGQPFKLSLEVNYDEDESPI
jgi:hypothetical protein